MGVTEEEIFKGRKGKGQESEPSRSMSCSWAMSRRESPSRTWSVVLSPSGVRNVTDNLLINKQVPRPHRKHTPPPVSAPQHVYAETLPINKTPKFLEPIPFELLIHRPPLPPTFPAILLHLPQFCPLISGRRTSKSLDNGTIHLVHPLIEFIGLNSFDPS